MADTALAEIWRHIFTFLSYDEVVRLRTVSKNWCANTTTVLSWNQFQIELYYKTFGEIIKIKEDKRIDWDSVFLERKRLEDGKEIRVIRRAPVRGTMLLDLESSKHKERIFQSSILNISLWSGKYFYEVEFIGSADSHNIAQVGWCTLLTVPDAALGKGIGDEKYSFSIDSTRSFKWHEGLAATYGKSFKRGDIVGIAIDIDSQEIDFYCNGDHLGKAWKGFPSGFTVPVFPAWSQRPEMEMKIILEDFFFPVLGYNPIINENEFKHLEVIDIDYHESAQTTKLRGYENSPSLNVIKRIMDSIVSKLPSLSDPDIPDDVKYSIAYSLALQTSIGYHETPPDNLDLYLTNMIRDLSNYLIRSEFSYYALQRRDQKRSFWQFGLNKIESSCLAVKEVEKKFKIIFLQGHATDLNLPLTNYTRRLVSQEQLLDYVHANFSEFIRQEIYPEEYSEKPAGKINFLRFSELLRRLRSQNLGLAELEETLFLCETEFFPRVMTVDQNLNMERARVLEAMESLEEVILKWMSWELMMESTEGLRAQWEGLLEGSVTLERMVRKYKEILGEIYFGAEEGLALEHMILTEIETRASNKGTMISTVANSVKSAFSSFTSFFK